jgi:hypothetical protein
MAITKESKISISILSAALLFCTVGCALSVADWLEYRQGVESRKWLPVEGKIKTQFVRLVNRDCGQNHFALNATYIYHIGEKAFMGDRVAFPNELSFTESEPEKSASDNKAKSMFARYAPEAPMIVYYNPAANDQSTLTRGASARRYLPEWLRDLSLIIFGAGLAIWRLSKGIGFKSKT